MTISITVTNYNINTYSITITNSKSVAERLERIQNKAVRSELKGRESVTGARNHLGLKTLANRQRDHGVGLLVRIHRDEEHHSALSISYDEIMKSRSKTTMYTRAASRGQLNSIYALSSVFQDRFLPRTIRDMCLLQNETDN